MGRVAVVLGWLLLAGGGAAWAAAENELVPPREIIQPEAPVPAWKEEWDRARALVRDERYREAAGVYEGVLARREHLYEVRWELARLWLRLGEAPQALGHFELLREAAPDDPRYTRGLAAALLAAGRVTRAAELFQGLLASNPDDPELLAGLVEALVAREREAEALPYLERLVALQAEDDNLREQLARLYQRQNRPGQARPLVRRLAQPAAASAALMELAAQVHEDLGRQQEAVRYWRRLLAVDPGHALAAARVKAFMLAAGEGEEALRYLRPALAEEPDNPRLLRRLGQVHLDLDQPARALPYLERYLELRPTDREVLQLALNTYNVLGQRAEALLILERLLTLAGEAAPEKLLQAARIYQEQGEDARALALYPRILAHYRDDPAMAIVAEKLRLLARFQRQSEIKAILASPRWREHNAEILAAWHTLEPDDRRVMTALATAYLERGDLAAGEDVVQRLAAVAPDDREMLRVRATLREIRDLPWAALGDYENILRQQPDREDIRRRALQLAAELGLPGRVEEHQRQLAVEKQDLVRQLEVVTARLKAMDTDRAMAHLDRLAAEFTAPAEQVEILLARAEAFRRAGLPYEAEKNLRVALLQEENLLGVYRALFELAMAEARYSEAELWLTAFERQQRFYPQQAMAVGGQRPRPPENLADRMRLRLLSASGEHRAALRLVRSDLPVREAEDDGFRLLAARVLWEAGAVRAAEQLLLELLERPETALETLVLAALISADQGRRGASGAFMAQALSLAERDPGRQLQLAEILDRYRWYPQAAAVAAKAAATLPESARAALLQAEALAAAGDNQAAWQVLEALPDASASLFKIRFRQLDLLLRLGHPAEVVKLSAELATASPWSESALILARVHALWMQRQWRPALSELEAGLTPEVATLLAAGAQTQGMPVTLPEPPGVWARITGAVDPLAELTDEVMEPGYAAALKPGDQRLRRVAAPLYAEYRWQQRFALEYQARRAVERRDFFAATRDYERLERHYPDQGPVLYDLAGLYSRQERWELEAAIYRRLQAEDLHYPGLAEARRRSDLKRRPRSSLAYGSWRETGRDGYKAVSRQSLTASQWWAPFLGHELDLALSRLDYRNPDGPGVFDARQAELLYRRDAFAGVDLLLGVGAWLPAGDEEEGRSSALGRAEIAGDFGDRFRGRLAYRRELVEDTLASIRRGILAESLTAEGALDLLPRLEAGSAYSLRYYSDHNRTHGYDLWLTSTILPDPTLLTAGYRYQFRDSRHGPQAGGVKLADGFAADDHPYWAPLNYWRKTFEVAFRHQLSDDPFMRDTPRYYTLSYATSYDSGGYGQQTLGGDFFLELGSGFIWQAGFEVISGSDYRRRRLDTSLTYRW